MARATTRSPWRRLQGRWLRLLDQIDEMGIIDFDGELDGTFDYDDVPSVPALRP